MMNGNAFIQPQNILKQFMQLIKSLCHCLNEYTIVDVFVHIFAQRLHRNIFVHFEINLVHTISQVNALSVTTLPNSVKTNIFGRTEILKNEQNFLFSQTPFKYLHLKIRDIELCA